MKKAAIAILAVIFVITLASCGMSEDEYRESLKQYPNSGEIQFNDVILTIPDGYIRDTTMEGTEEGYARRWEQGNYRKIITISKHEQIEMDESSLETTKNNQRAISVSEPEIEFIPFHGEFAIESTVQLDDGTEMKYLMFNIEGYTYHFSVQGDTSDYETIKDSITF